MKYRLAGASYRAIAEKLTEERASEYADVNGISVERAMKKIPHVSKRTVWDDVTAEWEELRRETEMQRADLMALENARLDQVFSKALSLFANGSVADWLSRRWDGVAFLLPDRCRYASRSEPVSRYAANASYAGRLGRSACTSRRFSAWRYDGSIARTNVRRGPRIYGRTPPAFWCSRSTVRDPVTRQREFIPK